ncbi:GAK system ATP-grasp enzyme [Marinospirillum alkaliphilum]|uniref:SSU ribosomal protein S6P modification protein n=1 Tax=Marinospirillum alkaliphilum DSM 21637 TaxID=1122209 RepID=A0A1K1WK55_9GAMM|nr:GAK system ATP-grasp enzyme [Marinospirillum alkaliphilum]SFX37784.1 SSU ribosomal protein S6P modification protein [Marinospirillum alkaliphilum DSM 21637]
MADPRIAVIGTPGKWSTEVMADALEERTGFRLVLDLAELSLDLQHRRLMAQGINLCELDAIVVRKVGAQPGPLTLQRLEMLRVAEAAGVRVFSPAGSLLRLLDRLACTVTLRNQDLPMPATRITASEKEALQCIQQWGQVILKPMFSSKARGMLPLSAEQPEAELKAALADYHQQHPLLYVQQRIHLPGQDMALVFLGGEYLGAYARVAAEGAWNTSTSNGGRYAACQPDASLIDLAWRAQKPFGLDFATVDLALGEQGPVVFEVSALGGFRGCQTATGLDIAGYCAEHALQQLRQGLA